MSETDWMQIAALAMAAILVAPAALRRARGRILPLAAIWLAIIVALVWGYETFGGG